MLRVQSEAVRRVGGARVGGRDEGAVPELEMHPTLVEPEPQPTPFPTDEGVAFGDGQRLRVEQLTRPQHLPQDSPIWLWGQAHDEAEAFARSADGRMRARA